MKPATAASLWILSTLGIGVVLVSTLKSSPPTPCVSSALDTVELQPAAGSSADAIPPLDLHREHSDRLRSLASVCAEGAKADDCVRLADESRRVLAEGEDGQTDLAARAAIEFENSVVELVDSGWARLQLIPGWSGFMLEIPLEHLFDEAGETSMLGPKARAALDVIAAALVRQGRGTVAVRMSSTPMAWGRNAERASRVVEQLARHEELQPRLEMSLVPSERDGSRLQVLVFPYRVTPLSVGAP